MCQIYRPYQSRISKMPIKPCLLPILPSSGFFLMIKISPWSFHLVIRSTKLCYPIPKDTIYLSTRNCHLTTVNHITTHNTRSLICHNTPIYSSYENKHKNRTFLNICFFFFLGSLEHFRFKLLHITTTDTYRFRGWPIRPSQPLSWSLV